MLKSIYKSDEFAKVVDIGVYYQWMEISFVENGEDFYFKCCKHLRIGHAEKIAESKNFLDVKSAIAWADALEASMSFADSIIPRI